MASFSNDKYLIPYDEEAVKVMDLAARLQTKYKNLYLMPEHVLLSLFQQKKMLSAVSELCDCKTLKKEATAYLKENAAEFASIWENKNDEVNYESVGHDLSSQCKELMTITSINASCAHQHLINPAHLLNAIYQLKESNASYILQKNMKTNYGNLLSKVMEVYKGGVVFEGSSVLDMIETVLGPISIESYQIDEDHFDAEEIANGTDSDDDEEWKSQLLCISDSLDGHNPLIGREAELDRTIQILCRKDKNNPLHIGEPGVGKTAIVYGLAKRIKAETTRRLQNLRIEPWQFGGGVSVPRRF